AGALRVPDRAWPVLPPPRGVVRAGRADAGDVVGRAGNAADAGGRRRAPRSSQGARPERLCLRLGKPVVGATVEDRALRAERERGLTKIIVDGREIDVPPEYTLLQACEAAGAEIPRFCFHERLSIAGNCRMCLIEVAGTPKPQASCAVGVKDLPPKKD